MNDLLTLELPCPPTDVEEGAPNAQMLFYPAGSVAEEAVPLSLVYYGREAGARMLRTRIELGRGARAKAVIRYEVAPGALGGNPVGLDGLTGLTGLTGWTAQAGPAGTDNSLPVFRTALDIHLAEDARLELFVVSALPCALRHEASDTAVLGDRTFLSWTEAGFDEGDGSYEGFVDLAGKGSELDFAGAYGASGKTDRTHVLNERHQAPGAKSRAVMKSALRESAHLCFRGLIHVEPGAPGTDAYLSNRNLILDDGARSESLPQLRIETDDVACSHGSATGGPREDELFYLMSRGLDRDGALRLLVLGHLGSVLDRAPLGLALELEAIAVRALGGADGSEHASGVAG